MEKQPAPKRTRLQKFMNFVITSRITNFLVRIPPIGWIVKQVAAFLARREISKTPLPRISPIRDEYEYSSLKSVVVDVVDILGFVGAMVATYEPGDVLPLREYYVNSAIASTEQIKKWENALSEATGLNISLSSDVARAYLHEPEYASNLSVQAVKRKEPVRSNQLIDLFVPIVPSNPITKNAVSGIQDALNIEEVIAVPFFVSTQDKLEIVGNLFAAKNGKFDERDINLLKAYGRQASIALENERKQQQLKVLQDLIYHMQSNLHDETVILQSIVEGVVNNFGFVGALVAPLETDRSLPIKAHYIDPSIASREQIETWEQQLSDVTGLPISLSSDRARVYLDDESYCENLSVQAALSGDIVRSKELMSLFVPVIPKTEITSQVVKSVQRVLKIGEVVAVPFYLTTGDTRGKRELVGNLFAATKSKEFSNSEIELLQLFAQQAAVGIKNSRLYRFSEDRRMAAQKFATMAFSATTMLHDIGNHLGIVRGPLEFVSKFRDKFENIPDELLAPHEKQALAMLEMSKNRTIEAIELMRNLHSPWRSEISKSVSIDECIKGALRPKKYSTIKYDIQDAITIDIEDNLPVVFASQDMLAEALRIIIKNALEAIQPPPNGRVSIHAYSLFDSKKACIEIKDNGSGIKSEDMSKIFDIGWSNKDFGMGFGLFWTKDYIFGLGGEIIVKSDFGHGTKFTVILPSTPVHEKVENHV